MPCLLLSASKTLFEASLAHKCQRSSLHLLQVLLRSTAPASPRLQDSGRFLRPSFEGYRVLITKASGEQSW